MHLSMKWALALTLLVALGTCYYHLGLLLPESRRQTEARGMSVRYSYGGDFYPIWLTGRALLLHRVNPYTPEMTRDIQTGLYGHVMDSGRAADYPIDYRAFSYPLYTDLLAAPVLPLSFDWVRRLLTLLLVPMTAFSVILWFAALGVRVRISTLAIATVLTLVSYPVIEGLYAEQMGLFAGFALAVCIYALTINRFFLAGTALAVASVKPQMIWLIAPCLLLWSVSDWKNRKRFALTFCGCTMLFLVASEALIPGWFAGWWRIVTRYSSYTLPPLPQFILGKWMGNAVAVALVLFALAVAWRARREPAITSGFSLACCEILGITALLLPTAGAVYDEIILLPAIFWIFSRAMKLAHARLPMRILVGCGIVALAWEWMFASAVSICDLFWPSLAHSRALLILPTRMAAPFPFVVFAILTWFAVSLFNSGDHKAAENPQQTVGPVSIG